MFSKGKGGGEVTPFLQELFTVTRKNTERRRYPYETSQGGKKGLSPKKKKKQGEKDISVNYRGKNGGNPFQGTQRA